MSRKDDLLSLVGDSPALVKLIEEMVYLEGRIEDVKKLPFIKVHPKDPTRQKTTAAAHQYKELLQQYTIIIRILMKAMGIDEMDEESPLRAWVKEHVNSEQNDLDS